MYKFHLYFPVETCLFFAQIVFFYDLFWLTFDSQEVEKAKLNSKMLFLLGFTPSQVTSGARGYEASRCLTDAVQHTFDTVASIMC